jgi:hypothetical protein
MWKFPTEPWKEFSECRSLQISDPVLPSAILATLMLDRWPPIVRIALLSFFDQAAHFTLSAGLPRVFMFNQLQLLQLPDHPSLPFLIVALVEGIGDQNGID